MPLKRDPVPNEVGAAAAANVVPNAEVDDDDADDGIPDLNGRVDCFPGDGEVVLVTAANAAAASFAR